MARPKPTGGPRRLTVAEVAERWSCGPKPILRAIQERRLPHFRIGRRVLIDETELERYEKEVRVTLEEAIERTRRQRRTHTAPAALAAEAIEGLLEVIASLQRLSPGGPRPAALESAVAFAREVLEG